MKEIEIFEQPVEVKRIKDIAAHQFGDMVKFVVDVEKEIVAVGGDLHADEEALLIEKGSEQKNLWVINLYPEKDVGKRIEFDSMINIRPSQNNRSRDIEDPKVRKKISEIVNRLVV